MIVVLGCRVKTKGNCVRGVDNMNLPTMKTSLELNFLTKKTSLMLVLSVMQCLLALLMYCKIADS